MNEYGQYLNEFAKLRVVVFGDVMLDRYLMGDVARISPEAPVPVVDLKEERLVAGGAANVAANIKGLGASADLIGIVGNDREAGELKELLGTMNISGDHLFESDQRPTTVKSRILAGSHQVARLDREAIRVLDENEAEYVVDRAVNLLSEADAFVISDYGKGVVDDKISARLITIAKDFSIPVLVDPKGLDYAKYNGANVLTPNKKEALELYHSVTRKQGGFEESGEHILKTFGIESLLITLGAEGIAVFTEGCPTVVLPASARKVFDVTGAGDTVIGTLAVAVASGADIVTAAKIANFAAGEVVGKVGTTPISIESLWRVLGSEKERELRAV